MNSDALNCNGEPLIAIHKFWNFLITRGLLDLLVSFKQIRKKRSLPNFSSSVSFPFCGFPTFSSSLLFASPKSDHNCTNISALLAFDSHFYLSNAILLFSWFMMSVNVSIWLHARASASQVSADPATMFWIKRSISSLLDAPAISLLLFMIDLLAAAGSAFCAATGYFSLIIALSELFARVAFKTPAFMRFRQRFVVLLTVTLLVSKNRHNMSPRSLIKGAMYFWSLTPLKIGAPPWSTAQLTALFLEFLFEVYYMAVGYNIA